MSEEKDKKPTNALTAEEREELFTNAGLLIDMKEEKAAILAELREANPEEFTRIDELTTQSAAVRLRTEELLRKGGTSQTISGYDFKVVPKTETSVRIEELVATARERGDLSTLLDLGLLTYTVKAEQIERLPGSLKGIYGPFITRKPATSAVTLPKALKE